MSNRTAQLVYAGYEDMLWALCYGEQEQNHPQRIIILAKVAGYMYMYLFCIMEKATLNESEVLDFAILSGWKCFLRITEQSGTKKIFVDLIGRKKHKWKSMELGEWWCSGF